MKKLFSSSSLPLSLLFILLSCAYSSAYEAVLEDSYLQGIGKSDKTKSIIKAINSSYYNLIDEKVRDIKFNFRLSEEKRNLEYLSQKRGGDVAGKIEKMDIFITCYPSRKATEISVLNKPFFDDEELDEYIAGLIKATEEVAKEFLTQWKRYVTRLIDPRLNQVKSVASQNGDVIIELVDRGNTEYKLVFDPQYKLKFWEAFRPFEAANQYRETPQFDIYDSKYLIKTVHGENVGKFEISYQAVNGIQVPEEVIFYSEIPNVPDITMFFTDAEVKLYE